MKRFITSILTGIMLISSLSVSAASFTDVKQGDWYYETVTEMTDMGLFKGKGNNLFCPNDTMTKAEFITVVVRAVYPSADISSDTGEKWWQGAYDIARSTFFWWEHENEFSIDSMEQAINRQEMAFLSVRALELSGDIIAIEANLADSTHIPDIKDADPLYMHYLREAYVGGLITGDDKGYFNPQANLTRAEASTVIYRIVEPSARIDMSFLIPQIGQQTIREGEQSKRVPAKEGDIFIKKDGTQIVLKKGPSGVVGEGQGVAPDIGMYGTNGGYVTAGDNWENKLMLGLIDESLYPYFVTAKGKSLNNDTYRVNATTGEGHWTLDWQIIEDTVAKPNYDGTTHGEVSKDAYSLYVWNDIVGMWVSNTTK